MVVWLLRLLTVADGPRISWFSNGPGASREAIGPPWVNSSSPEPIGWFSSAAP